MWKDALPAFQLLQTVQEVRSAIEFSDALVGQLAGERHTPAAREFVLAKLSKFIGPFMGSAKHAEGPIYNCKWEDVKPAMAEVHLADLREALENNDLGGLLEELASQPGEAARLLLVARLRPSVEPWAWEENLTWSDVKPALLLVETNEMLAKGLAMEPATH